MVALVIVLTIVVLLLAVLVAGLLRSHADILKALHDLGVGVGDPAEHRASAGPSAPVPVTIGPPLPGERSSASAPTVVGVTPDGDALAVAVATGGQLTLLAFLSSGCATCAGFWNAFRQPEALGLPEEVRLIVVTKGPELEIPGEVRSRAPAGLQVVMSTDAWGDYEVPGSPFFVLVDGRAGRRIGEGVANHFQQVAELVRRAQVDAGGARTAPGTGSRGRALAGSLDGPERESANDRELLVAGILPGDASLYPATLDDVFGRGGVAPSAGPAGSGGAG